MEAIKPILRYLTSRKNDSLTYYNKVPIKMECYTDSDYAEDTDARRSVSEILVTASEMVLVWASSRQATVSHRWKESGYVAADTGATFLLWLESLANELRIALKQRTILKINDKAKTEYYDGEIVEDTRNDLKLLVDNKGVYDIANSYGPSKRTKVLDVRHHYIQKNVNQKSLKLNQVPTTEQEINFLTKPVSRILFKK